MAEVGVDVVITALGRHGAATRLSRIELCGPTATESALRITTRPADAPIISAATRRSFPSSSAAEEVLRLLPSRPDFHGCDAEALRLPWEALGAFASAPDGVVASYVRAIQRWSTTPECLSSVRLSVAAEFFVTTAGPTSETARWWVSGDAGWVGLGLDAGQVAIVPSSGEEIRCSLLTDLVCALDARPT